jgi:hypothetical protein
MADGKPATSLLELAGLKFKGWQDDAPGFAVVTAEPAARIAGLSPGESVYQHVIPNRALLVDPGKSIVLTRLSTSGTPDLIVAPAARMAVSGCRMNDVLPAWRPHLFPPDYYRDRANQGYLMINVVRMLLGLEPVLQPASFAQRQWSDRFYAYAMGRYFVRSVVGADGAAGVTQADGDARRAAIAADRGDFNDAQRLYRRAVERLASRMDQKLTARRFLYRGWHASLLYDDYHRGGLVGYAECADSEWLLERLNQRLGWARQFNAPVGNDICPSTWEILNKYFPDRIKPLATACQTGLFETSVAHYTHAYLQVLSEQCNIRQVLYGRRVLREVLGAVPTVWACAGDHYNFHPQLPQLLTQLGCRGVLLRCSDDTLPQLHDDTVRWRGLDGSEVDAVPTYADVRYKGLGYAFTSDMVQANQSGHRNLLFGHATDALHDSWAEKEHAILNSVAPVTGKFTTLERFLDDAPTPEHTRYFGPDELYGAFPHKWTGLGWMNDGFRRNREIEKVLLAAECFDALASITGKPSAQKDLQTAWKDLLMTHDHLSFGPPGHYDPKAGGGATGWARTADWYRLSIPNWSGLDLPVSQAESATTCAERARQTARTVLDNALSHISQQLQVSRSGAVRPRSSEPSPGETRSAFLVFNSLGWERTEPVQLDVEFTAGRAKAVAIEHAGRRLPCQMRAARKHDDGTIAAASVVCLANLPPLGCVKLEVVPVLEPDQAGSVPLATATRLESDHYVVELDAQHGGIRRIFDRLSETELLDCTRHFAGELFSPEQPAATSIEATAAVELLEHGPVCSAVQVKAAVANVPYTSIVRLYHAIPRIEVQLELDYGRPGAEFGTVNWSKKTPELTGLFTAFPVRTTGPPTIHQPFGLYPCRRSPNVTLDLLELPDSKGRTVLIHDSSPVFWHQNGTAYFGLTQGAPAIRDVRRYGFAIVRLPADAPPWRAFKESASYNTPSWPVACAGNTERIPLTTSFVSVSPDNLVLSSLYVDDDRLYARLHEIAGQRVEGSFRLLHQPRTWQRVTLEGKPLAPAQQGNPIEFPIAPWKILTFRAVEADQGRGAANDRDQTHQFHQTKGTRL